MSQPDRPATHRSKRETAAVLGGALMTAAALVLLWALLGAGSFGPLWIGLGFVLLVGVTGARCR